MWLALEDATLLNGCLWAIPGSHKSNSLLPFRSCLARRISLLEFSLSNFFFSCSVVFKDGLVRRFLRGENGVYFDQPSPSYDQKDFVPIEVKAGSLVLIHGDLIHQR